MQVHRVAQAIIRQFGHEVRWPTKLESKAQEEEFYRSFALLPGWLFMLTYSFIRFGIRGIRAAMDGTDINIRTPSSDVTVAYYNKDGFHSIRLHAVCDSQGIVYEASVGACGSSADSTVWKDQPLFKCLHEAYDLGLYAVYWWNTGEILLSNS